MGASVYYEHMFIKETVMPRPRKQRMIQSSSVARYYKPQGVPMRDLKSLPLTAEGIEALRLVDVEGFEHTAAAEVMNVSRPTFSRLLAEARTTSATALVNGWALDIEGHADDESACANGRGQGHGRGHKQGQGCGHGRGNGAMGGMRRRKGHQNKWMNEVQIITPEDADMNGLYAISAKGETLDTDVDPRFGRAPGFVLVNATGEISGFINNVDSDGLAHGAGLSAAELIAKAGVKTVLTGKVGPKATAALHAAGVQIIEGCDGQTVAQAFEKHVLNVGTDA